MKEEKIDCPLCGAKEVILLKSSGYIPYPGGNIFTRKPKPIGFKKFDFDRHDFSHAEMCPKLSGVHDPQNLLRYHTGHMVRRYSDFHSFDQYQLALNNLGFRIVPESIRINDIGLKKKWQYSLYIDSTIVPGSRLLSTKGKDFDEAFDYLRHRLRCGEMIIQGSIVLQRNSGHDPLIFDNPKMVPSTP